MTPLLQEPLLVEPEPLVYPSDARGAIDLPQSEGTQRVWIR
jgi:hypothetical protein